jgi:hypothetical protein
MSRWRAGDVAQVVGWRGMYPGSKLYADFGHFLGVSQGRHSFGKAGRPWDVSGFGGRRHKADRVRVAV